ncbi:unnamed protein product [Mucor hiemalis]
MSMEVGDTANQYYNKFSNAATEAGYKKEDTTIADFFFNGFPEAWQAQINTVLAANGVPLDSPNRTVSKIAEEANNVFNNIKNNVQGVKRGHYESQGNSQGYNNGKKKFALNGIKGQVGKNDVSNEGNRNVPYAATNNRKCDYCKRERLRNHYCEQYMEAKRAGKLTHKSKYTNKNGSNQDDYNILSVAKVDDEQEVLSSDPMFDCKYYEDNTSIKNKNPFNLITPIIIEGVKLMDKNQ